MNQATTRRHMHADSDVLMQKLEFIMESPTERNRYKRLKSYKDKLNFLKNHFIMSDMAIRLLERQYLLSPDSQEELMNKVDQIISRMES
ncbi:hypothetical protein [Fulvivirga sedimenti]|uniref:Uncharacterized protein n=1 Tax=Fulvivirga sedimenti TaxID=2879465 RepID=A0A9X1KWN1_9BACT|nr:hypothetical protein [Fulvivirga sedimenti]MCA6073397.1 hypothetical protein [Fulvivirga sedimenti]